MRKKLSTRFPAARIKKIMQADEEVGKIALATPVLISKALELFLQDLCDRTYQITVQRGAKTVSSLHLKQCVERNTVYDFLREVVAKVPDIGNDVHGEEKTGTRRRKSSDENDIDTEEGDSKRLKQEACAGRGRGRGRRRGTKNGAHVRNGSMAEKLDAEKSEEADTDISDRSSNELATSPVEVREVETTVPEILAGKQPVRDFDLNVDPNDNGDAAVPSEIVQNEIVPKWSESLASEFNVEALHLHLNHNRHFTEDEDDYDCDNDEDC